MSSKEIKKNCKISYDNHCKMIKNKIINEFKNYKFDFIRNPNTLEIEIIIDNNSVITILHDNTWDEIKRHINKKILGFKGDCGICCKKINKNVTCNKCSNNCCVNCYINLFKFGKGIITCPYCKYSFGILTPDYMMDVCINEIKHKCNINSNNIKTDIKEKKNKKYVKKKKW